MRLLNVSSLPTTALSVLLENQQIARAAGEHLSLDNLYYSTNLASLPDIHDTGRDFYTLLYQLDIAALNDTNEAYCRTGYDDDDDGDGDNEPARSRRQTLRFSGINYRATAWLDGTPLTELSTTSRQEGVPGMFLRRSYDVTAGGRFNILIEPPDHPGSAVAGGQGGNHALAQDGATAQFMLGWDWCQAMPDRATGFYAATILERTRGSLALLDPAIQTLQLECNLTTTPHLDDPNECTFVRLRVLARIETFAQETFTRGEVKLHLKIQSDWGETWQFEVGTADDLQLELLVKQPEKVKLWWPHGVGLTDVAHLHSFSFSLTENDTLSDVKTINVGIRTVETSLDQDIQGQRFWINGKAIYLVGGNWIASDQALRFSASKDRYCNEIALHRHAGLNFLRVWGGGTAERDEFYDCASRIGMLVLQEFWMTGDNNGRWGGNYSWPLDYDAYLTNVEDTVKRLRRHASLLFYCGCNECLAPRNSTWAPNPPHTIDQGIQRLLKTYDPGRFYISSSMSGVSGAYYSITFSG